MKLKVSMALEAELVERLDRIAGISGESRSQVMERMVRDQIAQAEQFANLMANPQARAALMQKMADPKVMGPMLRALGDKPSKSLNRKMMEAAERIGRAVEDVKKNEKGRGKGHASDHA